MMATLRGTVGDGGLYGYEVQWGMVVCTRVGSKLYG